MFLPRLISCRTIKMSKFGKICLCPLYSPKQEKTMPSHGWPTRNTVIIILAVRSFQSKTGVFAFHIVKYAQYYRFYRIVPPDKGIYGGEIVCLIYEEIWRIYFLQNALQEYPPITHGAICRQVQTGSFVRFIGLRLMHFPFILCILLQDQKRFLDLKS